MDPNAQRLAVAELRGWKFSKIPGEFRYVAISPTGEAYHANFGNISFLPDFLNDLNAVWDAEAAALLTEQQCAAYSTHLCGIVKGFPSDPFHGVHNYMWHANAAQRSEALLRTCGKWVEEGLPASLPSILPP